MAFPMLVSLPSFPSSSSSSRVAYPSSSSSSSSASSPPAVGIKLVAKKRWSIKRVLLLLLTAVSGHDFCHEFSLGAGSKGPPVQIAAANKPKHKQQHKDGSSWRERSLALLRIRSTRKAPPPLPPPTVTAGSASVGLRYVVLPPSPHHSSTSASVSRSVYCNQEDQQSEHDEYEQRQGDEGEEKEEEEKELTTQSAREAVRVTALLTPSSSSPFPSPVLPSPSSSSSPFASSPSSPSSGSASASVSAHRLPPHVRSPGPWHSAHSFTQLVEA